MLGQMAEHNHSLVGLDSGKYVTSRLIFNNSYVYMTIASVYLTFNFAVFWLTLQ